MLRILKKKEVLVFATWFKMLAIGFLVLFLVWMTRAVYPFLAYQKMVDADVLIVDGNLPSYALESAKEEFESGTYSYVLCMGGPVEIGSYLSQYENFAKINRKTLLEMGLDSNRVFSLGYPEVNRDRTYNSALQLKEYIEGKKERGINIISLDAHSRRTYYLYKKALPKDFPVGIIAVPNSQYEGHKWWKTSYGFRRVLNESLALAYSFLFFHPEM